MDTQNLKVKLSPALAFDKRGVLREAVCYALGAEVYILESGEPTEEGYRVQVGRDDDSTRAYPSKP